MLLAFEPGQIYVTIGGTGWISVEVFQHQHGANLPDVRLTMRPSHALRLADRLRAVALHASPELVAIEADAAKSAT